MYPKPCAGTCNRILRPGGSNPADYPTADLEHHAHGLCARCYKVNYRNPELFKGLLALSMPGIKQIRHDNNVAGLNRFMARIKGKSKVKVTR